ncbi:MAG: beta-lactamase family protein [Proteobacteria bacterium]|nr:beta-lactamase family protein [Pseudomonadota bacterium]
MDRRKVKFTPLLAAVLATCAVVCAATASAASDNTSPAGLSSATQTRIDSIANAWIRSGRSAGLAVGIARDGTMVFARGYGYANLEDKVPVTADTVFRIGSITKQFTAAALALLAEHGQLSLEDPVSKYIPGFPKGGAVSIRRLLNHTSGIHNMVEDLLVDPRMLQQLRLDHTPEDLLANLESHPALYDFPPGTGWHYSNSGYMVAGMIAERVCREDLQQYLQEQIFTKLGMTHSAIDDNETVVEHRAVGYDPSPARPGTFQRAQFAAMSGAKWSGGIRSTLGDLVRWHDALFSGRVLGPVMLKQMLTPGKLLDGRPANQGEVPKDQSDEPMAAGEYALGLNISELAGHRQIGHDGNLFGASAILNSYPDDRLTLVVLSNTSGGVEGGKTPVWAEIALAVLQPK